MQVLDHGTLTREERAQCDFGHFLLEPRNEDIAGHIGVESDACIADFTDQARIVAGDAPDDGILTKSKLPEPHAYFWSRVYQLSDR